jgi:transcriptional regulator with XRE-family HTH domain
MKEKYMLLSELVLSKRKEMGLSLNSLARAINVSPMFISKIENNRVFPEKGGTIEGLSVLFKIPVTTLQKVALESKELSKLHTAKNENINKYRLALARAMVSTDLSEDQLASIEEIIGRDKK